MLLGVMSGGVMAQATYSFEFVGSSTREYPTDFVTGFGGSASLIFTVDNTSSMITNVAGSVSNGSVDGSGNLNRYHVSMDPKYTLSGNNVYYPSASYVLDIQGVNFSSDNGYLFNLASASSSGPGYPGYILTSSVNGPVGGLTEFFLPGGGTDTSYGSLSAAPEIDGSLAPKVGFLLGCLFLIFGRKKQNTEPMLTA